MEREMRLLEDEKIKFYEVTIFGSINIGTEVSKIKVRSISELLSKFNGSEDLFWNWEKNARLLIWTYLLEDKYAKIMLKMRLNDKAQWFHSPEHIKLSVDEILSRMWKMYDHRKSKLKLRK